mmetsp:Transcript_65339/g.206449  ORF Transcript_65339/g.206449 Transcript_65339/m.206449 type:complete len:233 (+) Transcript_65339:246-944(+)
MGSPPAVRGGGARDVLSVLGWWLTSSPCSRFHRAGRAGFSQGQDPEPPQAHAQQDRGHRRAPPPQRVQVKRAHLRPGDRRYCPEDPRPHLVPEPRAQGGARQRCHGGGGVQGGGAHRGALRCCEHRGTARVPQHPRVPPLVFPRARHAIDYRGREGGTVHGCCCCCYLPALFAHPPPSCPRLRASAEGGVRPWGQTLPRPHQGCGRGCSREGPRLLSAAARPAINAPGAPSG